MVNVANNRRANRPCTKQASLGAQDSNTAESRTPHAKQGMIVGRTSTSNGGVGSGRGGPAVNSTVGQDLARPLVEAEISPVSKRAKHAKQTT